MLNFLFGVLFSYLVTPFLDSLAALIKSSFDFLITKISLKTEGYVLEYKRKNSDMIDGGERTFAVGFDIGGNEEEYEEDEEEWE